MSLSKIEESSSKMKIEDWIYYKLEENITPGLKWIDKESKTFSLIWIHGSNLIPINDSDVLLARQWAEHKGKRKKDDKRLKATLRCALNSSAGLRFIRKEKTYRVYQFVPEDNQDDALSSLDGLLSMFFDGPEPDRRRHRDVDEKFVIVPPYEQTKALKADEIDIFGSNSIAHNCQVKTNFNVDKINGENQFSQPSNFWNLSSLGEVLTNDESTSYFLNETPTQ